MKISLCSPAYQQSVFQRDYSGKNISQSVTHKIAAKASWHRNYVTVTLCMGYLYVFTVVAYTW